MDVITILLIAIGLAMDCFAVSVAQGLDTDVRDSKTWPFIGLMAFLFGFFQAMMPLLGWLGISYFKSYMEDYDHWIAFGMLAIIGGKMIWESFGPEEEKHFNPRRLHTQLLLAIATSIDALAIGISFACTGYNTLSLLTLPLFIIGLASFILSLVGYYLGRRFGNIITRRLKPELFGGFILVGIGIKILLSHLFE